MIRALGVQLGCWICGMALLSSPGFAESSPAPAICYGTQAAAVDSMKTGSSQAAVRLTGSSTGGGYRVARVQSDPLLDQEWVMVARCDHPEWPLSGFPASEKNAATLSSAERQKGIEHSRSAPTVRAGDVVRWWKQETLVRIEASGIAEDSGEVGERIRVRILPANTEDPPPQESIVCVVVGPAVVEMQP